MIVDDVAQFLHNNSLGSLGTSLFKSRLPAAIPAAVNYSVLVKDTGGTVPDAYLPTRHPTFQVFIRAKTYTAGKTVVDSIRDLLHNTHGTTLISGGTHFYYIHAQQEPGHLGTNDAGEHEFSINFLCLTR